MSTLFFQDKSDFPMPHQDLTDGELWNLAIWKRLMLEIKAFSRYLASGFAADAFTQRQKGTR